MTKPLAFRDSLTFECAHHQLGHVDQPHPPRNSFEHLMNESIADCVATLRVREEANASYKKVIDDLRVESNVTNCYENYGSSAEFIESPESVKAN